MTVYLRRWRNTEKKKTTTLPSRRFLVVSCPELGENFSKMEVQLFTTSPFASLPTVYAICYVFIIVGDYVTEKTRYLVSLKQGQEMKNSSESGVNTTILMNQPSFEGGILQKSRIF